LKRERALESTGALDAKSRLSELLRRTLRGESFEVTRHGRPVGRLVRPDGAPDPEAVAAALGRTKAYRGMLRGVSREDLLSLRHEGKRF
jgi:antitoxin (DNA-binding transcriptional repressor) of toxin-antitoxin stability system